MSETRWWIAEPTLLDDIRTALTGAYSSLELVVAHDAARVIGAFPVWHDGEELDRYEIEVDFPARYPDDPPSVREVGGRVPHVAERHNSTGTACLFVPLDWKSRRPDLSFQTFLDEPVKKYFASQSLIDEGETWPGDERSHGIDGVAEAIRDLVGLASKEQAFAVLALLARGVIKGHWDCACGSKRRMRDCHGPAIRKLHTPSNIEWARQTIRAYLDARRHQTTLLA